MKTITLSIKNGKPYLEILDDNKRRGTNNRNSIKDILDSLPKDFTEWKIKGDDVSLYNDYDKSLLNLINYKENKNILEFKIILDAVKDEVPLFERERTYYDRSKVRHVNRPKLASIASIVLSVSIIGGVAFATYDSQKTNITNPQEMTTIEVDLNNLSSSEMGYATSLEYSNYDQSPVEIPERTPEIIVEEVPVPIVEDEPKPIEEVKVETLQSMPEAGSGLTEYEQEYIENFINSDNFDAFEKYSEAYNLDPYLLLAIAYGESSLHHKTNLPGGETYNGAAVGICQIEETNQGGTISAYNGVTQQTDLVTITSQNVLDYDINVQIGAIMFKNCLDKYSGNIYIALQAYNYGQGMMDSIISKYAKDKGLSVSQVINNQDDLGWLDYVYDANKNPSKYIEGCNLASYGTPDYIERTMGHYMGNSLGNNAKNR